MRRVPSLVLLAAVCVLAAITVAPRVSAEEQQSSTLKPALIDSSSQHDSSFVVPELVPDSAALHSITPSRSSEAATTHENHRFRKAPAPAGAAPAAAPTAANQPTPTPALGGAATQAKQGMTWSLPAPQGGVVSQAHIARNPLVYVHSTPHIHPPYGVHHPHYLHVIRPNHASDATVTHRLMPQAHLAHVQPLPYIYAPHVHPPFPHAHHYFHPLGMDLHIHGSTGVIHPFSNLNPFHPAVHSLNLQRAAHGFFHRVPRPVPVLAGQAVFPREGDRMYTAMGECLNCLHTSSHPQPAQIQEDGVNLHPHLTIVPPAAGAAASAPAAAPDAATNTDGVGASP